MERDLDATFRADRVVVRGGYRSVLALPLDSDARQVLWLVATAPRARTLQRSTRRRRRSRRRV